MFTIKRKGETVEIQIYPHVPGAESWYYTATLSSNSEVGAQLIANAIETELIRRLKEIRSAAYESGFSDAKAKRKRESWFSGHL